jgi:pilus assembly protein Flp/PilA
VAELLGQREKNMKTLMTAVKAFWVDEEGATAIEYGLIVALIAVVIITAVTLVGTNLEIIFNKIANELVKPPTGGGGSGSTQ